jgi:hypothetical protein
MNTIENNNGLTVAATATIIWGVNEVTESMLPIQNAPVGDKLIVLRRKQAGKVYIRQSGTVRCFILSIEDGKLICKPELEQAAVYFADTEIVNQFWNSLVVNNFQ